MLTKSQEAAREAAIKAGLNPGSLKAYPDGWEQPTGAEIRLVMKLAGLTGSKAAALTGNDDRTVRRWVSDDRKISYSAWAILLAGAGLGFIWEGWQVAAPAPACKKGVTVLDLHKARTLAAQWFSEKCNQDKGGFVIVLNGAFDGWIATISKPTSREPGSIAVNDCGEFWLACGDNTNDGVQRWESLQ